LSSLDGEEIRLLREILKWIRFSGMKEVRGVIDNLVDDEKKRSIYQLSNGSLTVRDIGEKVGVGKDKVASLWKLWSRAGLGETIVVKGGGSRFKKSFDLEELGIEVKTFESQAVTQDQTPQQTSEQDSLSETR
jgi:hypothetical protein